VIEYRWAEGKYDRLPALVPELLAQKVAVIVTAGTPASHAVKKATTTVPLVMVAVGDPVASGLVPNLTRPGGNITGLTSRGDELEGKRLELLRELIPTISHAASLSNFGNASMKNASKVLLAVATALKVKVLVLDVQSPDQLEGAGSATQEARCLTRQAKCSPLVARFGSRTQSLTKRRWNGLARRGWIRSIAGTTGLRNTGAEYRTVRTREARTYRCSST
jgi:ABC transporter substrate binding protein